VFEFVRPLDRFAAGKQVNYRVDPDLLQHPRIRRAFRGIRWILAAEVLVGLAAVVIAIVLTSNGQFVAWAVWFRSVAVLGITVTLYYFATRGAEGYYWGYSRLRLFSHIFPVVTLVIAAIPGLYPFWMTIEQIIFSLLMIGIGDLLRTDHMREAFPRPARATGPVDPLTPPQLPPPLPPLGIRDPGDAWVEGPDGVKYWGRFGAAGLLVWHPELGVLMQHRIAWSHFGGTWGIPGGARKQGESAEAGALREAAEEATVSAQLLRIIHTAVLDLGFWSYTTVVAEATEIFDPIMADAESTELRWVPVAEVDSLPLHPGFAASWPELRGYLHP
jgi:8-oxo-dGTP pyrophosphatase MutT (NUDIX family)